MCVTGHGHHRADHAVTPLSDTLDVRSQWFTIHITPLRCCALDGRALRFPPEFGPGRLRSRFFRVAPEAGELGDMPQGPLEGRGGRHGRDRRRSPWDRPPSPPQPHMQASSLLVCDLWLHEKTLKLLTLSERPLVCKVSQKLPR